MEDDQRWSSLADLIKHLRCLRDFFTSSPRDDCDEVMVEELGRRAREARDEQDQQCEKSEDDRFLRSKKVRDWKIFRELWSEKAGSRDWRDDWSSFPLSQEQELQRS